MFSKTIPALVDGNRQTDTSPRRTCHPLALRCQHRNLEQPRGAVKYDTSCQEREGILSVWSRPQVLLQRSNQMQYGFILLHGDIHTLAELTKEADGAGGDGGLHGA